MTRPHGGYRAPSKPNAVSGPGKYSRRTDGGAAQVLSAVPDQPYGEVKQQLDAQRIAPMAGVAPTPTPSVSASQGQQPEMAPQYSGPGFGDPSSRPDEPVTAGADVGPGAGSEALSFQPGAATPSQGTGQMTALLQTLSSTDTTGVLGKLLLAAQSHGV